MEKIRQTLASTWGFDRFRTGQRETIESILSGRPVLSVMPTGAGKSLCYQLPAVMLEGVTVVVSPLIALMKDQVDSLRARGIPAAFINSTLDHQEQRSILEDAVAGRLKLLYLAPERFGFAGAMAALQRVPISLFAIDEAHCISQWGHDFRPSYMNVGRAAAALNAPRIAAFTATATARVRQDIVRSLALDDPHVMVAGFLRPNLHFSVIPIKKMRDKEVHLREIMRATDGAMIVYCATRKNTEEVARNIRGYGRDVVVYHGGLSDDDRASAQDAFAARDDLTIVATNAFGMGVDKAGVRAVVHWDIPGSLDAYYQEAGRAGRDGERAWAILLFTYADTRVQEFFIDKGGESLPPDAWAVWADGERQKLRAVVSYAYEEGCRHSAILRYFGDRADGCGPHSVAVPPPSCDNCAPDAGLITRTAGLGAKRTTPREPRVEPRPLSEEEEVVVQKVLSAVARSKGRLSARGIARILRGSKSRDAIRDPMSASKSYGMLREMKEGALMSILGALARAGCTARRNPVLTKLGREAMWRRTTLQLDVPNFTGRSARSARGRRTDAVAEALGPEQKEVFRLLKQRRFETAQERGVPAFVVATNKVLEQLARIAPDASREDWLELRGVGEQSVDPLRETFLTVIEQSVSA